MTAYQSPEHRLIRTDYELMQLDLSPTVKGEAIERILKVELEPRVDCSFTKGRIRTQDGQLSNTCDLIAYNGSSEDVNGSTGVPADNAFCVIESKSDLSVSALENKFNGWIKNVRRSTDVPVFVVSIRHYNTRDELLATSAADETVACGTLREQGDATAMAHSGEIERLSGVVRSATEG